MLILLNCGRWGIVPKYGIAPWKRQRYLALADDQKTIRTGTAVMQKELRPDFCELLMVHRLRAAGNRIFRNARNAPTSVRIGSAVALVFVLLACAAAPAVAQQRLDTLDAEKDEPLPEKVNDPTASLTQIQMKDIYTPAEYGTNAQPNTVQFRSVLTIRPYSLIPVEQLIRPTLKVVTLPNGKGSSTTNAYDDMQLFDLFVIPWPNSRETLFRWGFGPYFIFPTSTSNRAGNGAWQIGPAAGFSFRQIPGLNIAGLLQQATSFRYTTSHSVPVSTLTIQPILSYQLGHDWYVKSSDATWTINWRHNTSTTIPLSAGFGKVWKLSDGSSVDTSLSGEWMVYRQFSTQTEQFTTNFQVTLLFPKLEF